MYHYTLYLINFLWKRNKSVDLFIRLELAELWHACFHGSALTIRSIKRSFPLSVCSSWGVFLSGAWLAFVTEVWILELSVIHMGDGSSLQLLNWDLPKNINGSDFLTWSWAPEGSSARCVLLLKAGWVHRGACGKTTSHLHSSRFFQIACRFLIFLPFRLNFSTGKIRFFSKAWIKIDQ